MYFGVEPMNIAVDKTICSLAVLSRTRFMATFEMSQELHLNSNFLLIAGLKLQAKQ